MPRKDFQNIAASDFVNRLCAYRGIDIIPQGLMPLVCGAYTCPGGFLHLNHDFGGFLESGNLRLFGVLFYLFLFGQNIAPLCDGLGVGECGGAGVC